MRGRMAIRDLALGVVPLLSTSIFNFCPQSWELRVIPMGKLFLSHECKRGKLVAIFS